MASVARIYASEPLRVEEIPGDERTRLEMNMLTQSWLSIAETNQNSAIDPSKREIFDASRIVNKVAFQRSGRCDNFKRLFTVVICYSFDLKIRAFAYVKVVELTRQKSEGKESKIKRFLHLNYLSSDPANLCQESRFKGAGSSLLYFLFEKCIQEKLAGIFVEPLPQAQRFLIKHGFVASSYTLSQQSAMRSKAPKSPK